jgi:hypothetical protein
MQAQWSRFLSHENALGLKVKLNGLGPPTRLRPFGEQFFGEVRENLLLKSRNGQTRRASWNNFEHCALHRRIHGSVDKPDLAWMVDIFDFNFGWALHGADR